MFKAVTLYGCDTGDDANSFFARVDGHEVLQIVPIADGTNMWEMCPGPNYAYLAGDPLEGSIVKYRLLAFALENGVNGVNGDVCGLNGRTCALCSVYGKYGNDCKGCPVMEKTGKRYCVGTPWEDIHHASQNAESCSKEIEFLVSLRPG